MKRTKIETDLTKSQILEVLSQIEFEHWSRVKLYDKLFGEEHQNSKTQSQRWYAIQELVNQIRK